MKKNILYVMIANIISLAISLVTNLMLPKYLSVHTYSQIKTYTLYLSYVGFFHFGYNDGMYLKYGGKELTGISNKEFGSNFYNYLFLELFVTAIFLIVGVFTRDLLIIAFSFGLLTSNIIGYFKSFYQAVGEFKAYSVALNLEKVILLIVNLFLLFIINTDDYILYIGLQVIIQITIMIYLTVLLHKKFSFINHIAFSFREMEDNIQTGFVLMLGNFSSGILTGLDRWFIKLLMNTASFAAYSFAVSLENMINIFVTPITFTLYNYLCNNHQPKAVLRIKKMSLIWGFLVISAAFPCKFVIENFIEKYKDASSIIFILFSTQIFYIVIKGIYINLYKVYGKQRNYFLQTIIIVVIAFVLNIIMYTLFRSKESIAVATLITSALWLIICEVKDEQNRFKINEVVAIVCVLFSFITYGILLDAVLGFFIYIITCIIVSCIFMRDSVVDIKREIIKTIKKLRMSVTSS